jgi:hypothetical protein
MQQKFCLGILLPLSASDHRRGHRVCRATVAACSVAVVPPSRVFCGQQHARVRLERCSEVRGASVSLTPLGSVAGGAARTASDLREVAPQWFLVSRERK